jgi:hypothetical protein
VTVLVFAVPWVFAISTPSSAQSVSQFVLRVPREYSVGRQAARIKVLDKAVSRQHAVLSVRGESDADLLRASDVAPTQQLWFRDVSTFGSSINGQRVPSKVDVRLRDNDRITLGENGCACRVHWQPMRVALSRASASDAEHVAALLLQCGAVQSSSGDFDWLVMSHVDTLSQKLLLALVSCVHVVSVQWLETLVADALAATDAEPPLPDAARFAPPLTNQELVRWRETDAVTLAPLRERQALFRRTVFVFFDQSDFDVLAAVVERGSGHAVRFDAATAQPSVAAALRAIVEANFATDEQNERPAVVFVAPEHQHAGLADAQLVAAERSALFVSRNVLLQAVLTGKSMSHTRAQLAVPSVLASRDLSVSRTKRRPEVVVNVHDDDDDDDDDDRNGNDGDDDGWHSRSAAHSVDKQRSLDPEEREVDETRAAAAAAAAQLHTDDAPLVVRATAPSYDAKLFRKLAPAAEPPKVVSKFAEAQVDAAARPELMQFLRDSELEERDEVRYEEQARALFVTGEGTAGVKRKR